MSPLSVRLSVTVLVAILGTATLAEGHQVAGPTSSLEFLAALEEDWFQAAEKLRTQERYPQAAEVYLRLLRAFPRGQRRAIAAKRLYDIADYWLDEVREEMQQLHNLRVNDFPGYPPLLSWVLDTCGLSSDTVYSEILRYSHYCHLDGRKPLLDLEGRTLELFGQIAIHDPTGPRAPNALFIIGSVCFYRGDFNRADESFSRLIEKYSKCEFVPRAIEMAIVAKHMAAGEGEDGVKKDAEIRALIAKMKRDYPREAAAKADELEKQLALIGYREAERIYQRAEKARSAGRTEEARKEYEGIVREFPNTPHGYLAREKLAELSSK
jgi:TolA-binding protein